MQFKLAAVSLALATLAAANPVRRGGEPAPSCTTGPVQCCQSVEPAGSPAATKALGLLNVVVQDVNVIVGLDCSPITVVSALSNSCTAQTVCCENNSYGGLVSIGCAPITL